ncbi:MAG: FecR domain-containing protein [Bacteroidota bacterium]
MEKNYDETFLARWIAGELTPTELEQFEKSPEYSEYAKINEGADRLIAPSYDRQAAWKTLREQTIEKPTTPTRKLFPVWGYGIAASVVLILGYFLFFSQTQYRTGTGETLTVELPDGSRAYLNAESSLSYSSNSWDEKRTIKLQGEAQFEVNKGVPFKVETAEGDIQVLGTVFLVSARTEFLDVKCFEGRVQVDLPEKTYTLNKSEGVQASGKTIFSYGTDLSEAPWLRQESAFESTPILQVVMEIERQFDITIGPKALLPKSSFTGRFNHTDVSLALHTVFDALEIKYTFDGNNNVTIKK